MKRASMAEATRFRPQKTVLCHRKLLANIETESSSLDVARIGRAIKPLENMLQATRRYTDSFILYGDMCALERQSLASTLSGSGSGASWQDVQGYAYLASGRTVFHRVVQQV